MTRLEAVNRILLSIGELPIDDLDFAPTEVELALTHLDMASKEVQLDGWYFNTEIVDLKPDSQGHIFLPYDSIKVVDLPPYVICINNKLYDQARQSFVFNKNIRCKAIKAVDFEDIPLSFALWVTLRAAKKYQNNTLTSGFLAENLEKEELEAMLLAKREHRQVTRPNVKGSSAGYDIKNVLRR